MWFLPSTERPESFEKALGNIALTAPDIRLCVLLHSGDDELEDYRDIISESPLNPTVVFHGHYGCARIWQFAFLMFPYEPFYGFTADDVEWQTPGWDKELVAAAGSCGMAWADDGITEGRIPTHFALGGELVRSVGYWGPPDFFHNHIDMVWKTIVDYAGIGHYCPDVKLRHHHWHVGTASVDRLHKLVASEHRADTAWFEEYTKSKDFKKLLKRVKRGVQSVEAAA